MIVRVSIDVIIDAEVFCRKYGGTEILGFRACDSVQYMDGVVKAVVAPESKGSILITTGTDIGEDVSGGGAPDNG